MPQWGGGGMGGMSSMGGGMNSMGGGMSSMGGGMMSGGRQAGPPDPNNRRRSSLTGNSNVTSKVNSGLGRRAAGGIFLSS